MERRQSERKRISANVYLRDRQQLVRCRASNLSASGAFNELTPTAMRPGGEVQLVFVLTVDGIIKLR